MNGPLERHSLNIKKYLFNVLITGESDFYDRNAQLIRDSFLKNPEFRSKEKLPFISFVGTSFLFGGKLENDAKNHMKSNVCISDLCWLAFWH